MNILEDAFIVFKNVKMLTFVPSQDRPQRDFACAYSNIIFHNKI